LRKTSSFPLSLAQNNTVPLDFELFVSLFEEYYLSDDPSDLGNFINGKLSYDEGESEDEDPGAVDHKDHHASSTSLHSMDDDLRCVKSAFIPPSV